MWKLPISTCTGILIAKDKELKSKLRLRSIERKNIVALSLMLCDALTDDRGFKAVNCQHSRALDHFYSWISTNFGENLYANCRSLVMDSSK